MITPFNGATSVAYCFNPQANFIMGGLALFFTVFLAIEYLGLGRFHRVAFLRRVRIVGILSKMCKQVIVRLESYEKNNLIFNEMEKKKHEEKSREGRTRIFIVVSLLLMSLLTVVIFVGILGSVFFKSLILTKVCLYSQIQTYTRKHYTHTQTQHKRTQHKRTHTHKHKHNTHTHTHRPSTSRHLSKKL